MDADIVILGEIALAAILGGTVGFEREMARKPAGMRTNMLISGGSAFFVALSEIMIGSFAASDLVGRFQYNPISVIEAIVVGISFIGAGTIIQLQKAEKVENLTTAATILFSAGIGISVALEQFRLAIGAAMIALIINYLLGKLEDWMTGKEKSRQESLTGYAENVKEK